MPIRIDLPDGTIGEFPDGMSDREIERVLQRQFGYTGPEKSDVGQQIIGNLGAILGDPKPSPYRAPLVEKPVVPLSTPYNTTKNKPGRGLLLAGDVPRAQAMIESEARKTRAAQEQQANADIERAFGTRSILGDTGESIGAAALRAPAIVGNLIKLPSTIYNAAGLPSDPRIGPDPLAVLGDALIAPADRANAARLPDLGIEDVGDALRPSVPMTLGERAATIGSAFQQGFTSSAADMAGAVIAPVPYAAGYTNQAATERAKNDGRDSANLGDLGIGAADAAVQTFFERWATKRLFTGAPGIAPSGITNTFKRIAKESGIQAATEFLEESFDYASTHYGTQKGGNFWDMVKQGLNGAFIGGPLGTAAQGTQEVFRGDPYESADRASLRNHIADRRTPQDQRLAAALELAQRGEWSNKALAQLGEVQTPMRTNIRANSEPEDRKRTNAIDPETLAAGNATLVTPQAPNAAPREPSQPAAIVPLGDAAVAPEPTADLDALIAANLPPAAPVPANPSIEGAGVAATPDIDWNAAAAALGIDPGELGAAASSLFGNGVTPAPVLDAPRLDAELGAPAPVLDAERIASLLGLPSEQAQQQVAAPEPAAVAPPAKPQAPEVQSEPGLPEPSRFGPLDLRQEIGWSQRGGELVRAAPRDDELNAEQRDGMVPRPLGEVIGRTRWTGWPSPDGTESAFWRTRPDRSLTGKQANDALDKFERGEKLRPIEQRFIDHAKATAAEYDRAMQLQEDAERGYSEVERQAALADMRAQHDINVLEADSSEALSLYELSRRAAERGVDDFDIAQAANESNQAYAARLWKLIEEADRGTDTGAAAEDRAGGDQGREGGPQRIQERGFQLAQQPAPEARQADQVAPSAGLFGAPTTRDFIDAAKRSRDDARNGQTGTGRTDMLAGDGELFAGARPEQASIPSKPTEGDKAQSTKAEATAAPTADPAIEAAIAEYGYTLKDGKFVTPSGKETSVSVSVSKGRARVVRPDGSKLWTGSPANVGKFLEAFWMAEKKPAPSVKGEGQTKPQPKPATPVEAAQPDNWLGEFFTPEVEAASRKNQAAEDAERVSLASRMRSEADKARAVADDWASRSYRGNAETVGFDGDGPGRETASIGAINEGRRRRAVEEAGARAKTLDAIADRIERGDDADIRRLVEQANASTDPRAGAADMMVGALFGAGNQSGPNSIGGIVRAAYSTSKKAEQPAPTAGEGPLESVEATPAFDAATATGAAVLRNGHLLSAIDAIKAAGGDLKAITDAVKARDGAALVRALDEALAAARPAPRVTGLKNAVTDAEREAAGRDPILKEAVKSNEATVYQAMRTVKNDPLAGPEAVARLESAGAEGISLADEAVMLVYKVELMNAREAAAKVLADTSAGEAAKQAARQAWEEAEAKIAAVDAAAVNAGREWGRFGQFRQRMMREDFTLAALERKERARLERPLTAEESATVKAMADKIADLQAKYDALQARMANAESEAAYDGLTREMRRPPRHRASPDSLRHAAEAARRRIREAQGVPSRRGQSGAIMSPALFYDYAIIGAYHIANGAAQFSDWVAAMRADIGDAWDRIKGDHRNIHEAAKRELEKPIRYDATVAEVLEKIDPANLKPSDVRKLAKAHIGEGLRGEPALIEALASDLGLSADEVRSLFVQSDTRREPTMSEAKQELQNLRKYIALQNEIDRLEAGIPKPPRAAPRPDSPAVAAKKAELAELRKKLRPVRDPEGRYQEMRGKQLQKRIDELKDRIARGDFATKPRVPRALSEANERLAFELDKAKEEFHRHQYLEMLKARSKWGKALGFVGDTFSLSRAVMTSVDLSGLLRQGGFVTFGRPVLGARAFFKTLPALLTEEAQHRIMGEIEARPNARLYRKYKLALTGSGGGPLAKVEEAYASRWLDRVALQADQPVRNAIRRARNLALAPTRGSGRVYAAFLSQLRADAFDAMAATMTRTGVPTEAEGKWIADFVNTATGRAKIWGRVDNPGEIVNTLAFAPRLVASRFSLATGTPVWSAPSARAKKMAAMEYARFATGIAVTMSLLAYGLGDDDEAFADHFTFDPRSSDFMKLKFGDTRLDPFTGLSQVITFTSRLLTGETVNGKGVLKPLRPKWTLTDLRRALGADIPSHEGITDEGKLGFGMRASDGVIGSFLRSKMAPIPGAVVNLLNGTDFKGDPITLAQQARELVLPMSFGDIYDVMQDQGIPRGTAMSVLGLLGMSMQVQTQTDKQAFAEFTDRLNAVRTDVKDRLSKVPLDEWQSEFDAMKEEYGPVMDGMELQYYKKDGEYGKKGEPRRDKYGKAVIDMRLSDRSDYDDGKEGTQVNHLIPDSLVRHHPMMKLARDAGYDLNNPNNLLPMPDKPTEGEIYHKGDHPKYTTTVFGALNAEQKRLKRKYGRMDKVPADELLDAVRKVEDDARKRIEAKDVPVEDGRLASMPMRAAAAV